MLLDRLSWKKIKEALPYLCIVWVTQLLVYYLPSLLPEPAAYADLSCAADAAIPYTKWAIIPYVAAFGQWLLFWLLLAQEGGRLMKIYIAADAIGMLIAFGFFLIMPTTMVRPADTGGGVLGWLTSFIYSIDSPTRLFPSLHCYAAWMWARLVIDTKSSRRWEKIAVMAVALVICASTVFVKQHLFYDIPSGIALAELCIVGVKLIARRRS